VDCDVILDAVPRLGLAGSYLVTGHRGVVISSIRFLIRAVSRVVRDGDAGYPLGGPSIG